MLYEWSAVMSHMEYVGAWTQTCVGRSWVQGTAAVSHVCQTDLCNGASSVQLPLTVALSTAILYL